MDANAMERLRKRVNATRARATVRSWEFRQRNLSSGVWFRLRRVLAAAETAWVISGEDVRRLFAEGYAPEACGREIAPEKTILFVGESRLSRVASRREIEVGLGPDFLAASAVALVAFDGMRAG